MAIITRTILVLCIVLLLVAFKSSVRGGRSFDVAAVDQIRIGKSTELDVLELLGSPLKTKMNADGTKKYGYAQVESRISATPFSGSAKIVGDKIVITFDKKGIVSGIERTSMPE